MKLRRFSVSKGIHPASKISMETIKKYRFPVVEKRALDAALSHAIKE